MWIRLCFFALVALTCSAADHPKIIVLVIDGLRPDVIRQEIMPNLARLKQAGVWCANGHSVFPTVTRVNSASIGSGTVPSVHGIVSNTMWVDAVSPTVFDTANYRNLTKLAEVSGGRTLPVKTLGEVLESAGIKFVAISSGSSGSGFLLNPTAPAGTGVLINSGLEEGKRAAFPDRVNQEIQKRFGIEQADSGLPSMLWAERVLRDYVIDELRPDVIIDWLTEPDGSQHRYGVGSPQGIAALKAADEQVGLLLAKLKQKGLDATTNILVTSDHGFAAQPDPVDLNGALEASGTSKDVIVASNGASAFLYVKNHGASAIRQIVAQLQKTDGVDVLFTASTAPENGALRCGSGKDQGFVPGTFALETIDQCSPSRGADVIVTFQWTSEKNEFGYPGTQRIASTDTRRGVKGRSGHGGLSSWMIHTPMILAGPDFKQRTVVEAPVANFDIAPTILALENITAPDSMRGRAITEAFAKTRSVAPKARVRTIRTEAGAFCSKLQLSEVGQRTYVDQGQRCGIVK